MRFGRGVGLLAAAALAVSGLAACGDETEPTQPSTTASPIDRGTDSPSETSNPSDGASDAGVEELPPAAREKTKAGAIAFNRAYQQMLGDALHTGGTSALKEYTNECGVCENFIQETEENRTKGITMDRSPYSARDAYASPRDDGGYKVTLTVDSSGYEAVKDGKTIGRVKPTTYTIVTDTQWHDGHWVIHDSVIVE